MKIRLLAFFITLSAAFTIKAQYVPIPDPAFVNWLVQNGNASCFNGSQLDTICAASNNSTGFMISNDASIVSISGIRYFKNIKTLLISGCSELTTITDYPYQLKTLEIYGGKLVSLPTMPNSLLSLVVAYNPTFTTLPNTLPASLVTGKPFTSETIGMAVAMRDLKQHLRETGESKGYNSSFTPRDRSAFLGALDQAVRRALRAAAG